MAVAVVIECKGATLDQYDQALAKMGRTPRGRGAPGSLFHWVTATDDGIRVTDVWETREEFEKFAQEQIGPIATEVGFPAPPEITFHDIHNYDSTIGSA
jgi:hypothetical protein